MNDERGTEVKQYSVRRSAFVVRVERPRPLDYVVAA
jgi:hypothetical protein